MLELPTLEVRSLSAIDHASVLYLSGNAVIIFRISFGCRSNQQEQDQILYSPDVVKVRTQIVRRCSQRDFLDNPLPLRSASPARIRHSTKIISHFFRIRQPTFVFFHGILGSIRENLVSIIS